MPYPAQRRGIRPRGRLYGGGLAGRVGGEKSRGRGVWSADMPSSALTTWRKERSERLDALLHAHMRVGGPARGRRWRAAVLSEALFLRLAAEFQGFARDLHQQACGVFASWIAPSNPTVEDVVRKQLVQGRELARGNAHPGAIGRDFGRLGFDVWPALAARDQRTAAHNLTLERLNDARNDLAHAEDARLARLREEGFPLALDTYRRWRGDLDVLAANLDAETAIQLGRLFDRERPW